MEQITQIAGIKTTSNEKDKFIKIVNDLMETIEEVCNGDKGNTEGNYLTLMNDLKKLYNMKEQMNGNVVYQSFRRPPPQPRQTHLNLQQKLQDPKYFKCEKCETTTLKKNRQRHYESDLCKITYQTKCSAVVVDTKQHKWYGIQQVLTSCFRTRKYPYLPYMGIGVLTPDKTCGVCNEKKWNIYEAKGYYALTEYSCGKIKKEFVQRHNLEGECNDCCFQRLEDDKLKIKLAKEEQRIKNREIKLAREAKKLAKEQAKEVSENLLMGENDINQNVKIVKKIIKIKVKKTKPKPKPVLIIEEEEEIPTPVLLRKIWIENYNKSLPQNKFYDSEFECEMSVAIGGIYDSEAMNFEWDNIQSNRIKELLKIVPIIEEEEEYPNEAYFLAVCAAKEQLEEEEKLPAYQDPPHGTIEYNDKGIKVMWDENEGWVEQEYCCEKCGYSVCNCVEEEKKWYVNSGSISKDFYKNYISSNIQTQSKKKFNQIFKDNEDEGDNFVDYYRISVDNKNDAGNQFSSLWFFDIDLKKGHLPVYLSGVNTSSCLAMEMCGMDRDWEILEQNFTLEEILDLCPCETSRKTIRNLLE
jgi:hypothetical protein